MITFNGVMKKRRIFCLILIFSCVSICGYFMNEYVRHGNPIPYSHAPQFQVSWKNTTIGSKNTTIGSKNTTIGSKNTTIGSKNGSTTHTPQTVTEINDQKNTYDDWPKLKRKLYSRPIPQSPFHPYFNATWDYNISDFLQKPHVKGHPPKIILWMVKPRYIPAIPELVQLRVCPEMPCRMTTNTTYQNESAALLWNGQIMNDPQPPLRSHPDQIYVFHNNEPQTPVWTRLPSFRKPAWKSAFNWTIHYRFDSDIVTRYGLIKKREVPLVKNYTEIVARKTKLVSWIVSNRNTHGKRDEYVRNLQKHIPVDIYGESFALKCPRGNDDVCFKTVTTQYKFYLSFESGFCKDYVSEKFFRYIDSDVVVVVRGADNYKLHSPDGIYINTADFKTVKDLADHLLYLDSHPEEYIKILKARDAYQSYFEDYPIRNANGQIIFMHYHYEAASYCELCRRLWEIENYRKYVPDILEWFDKGNCYVPNDT